VRLNAFKGVIASEAKQSKFNSSTLFMDCHGGRRRLAITLRDYSTGFRINPRAA
jgi:hypothetical protein